MSVSSPKLAAPARPPLVFSRARPSRRRESRLSAARTLSRPLPAAPPAAASLDRRGDHSSPCRHPNASFRCALRHGKAVRFQVRALADSAAVRSPRSAGSRGRRWQAGRAEPGRERPQGRGRGTGSRSNGFPGAAQTSARGRRRVFRVEERMLQRTESCAYLPAAMRVADAPGRVTRFYTVAGRAVEGREGGGRRAGPRAGRREGRRRRTRGRDPGVGGTVLSVACRRHPCEVGW